MRVLILAGEGPYFKNDTYLSGSLFDTAAGTALDAYFAGLGTPHLDQLIYRDAKGAPQPLLRSKRDFVPHLSTYTLETIMRTTDADFEIFSLRSVWDNITEPAQTPDVVMLSTTFICEGQTLRRAIKWINSRFPDAMLVLGGQYSNIKYNQIMREFPSVSFIVRGDGETAIPLLLDALSHGREPTGVPNLIARHRDGITQSAIEYIDIDSYPSPRFPGEHPLIAYESMRGCPFSCGFCSYPAASPRWRYKSAGKIRGDWQMYASENGAKHIRAMDSTFTVPPARLRKLLPMLHDGPTTWEAYTRANSISSAEIVDELVGSRCKTLAIGFESMSPKTLEYMNKKVTVDENRRCHDLLTDSPIGYRCSFMVGYPGETPEDYELTKNYILGEFSGNFIHTVFSFVDETMPVFEDAERFRINIRDPDDPLYSWDHVGMSFETADALMRQTLDEARWATDKAVLTLWQIDWQTPLVPHFDKPTNLWLEKLVERLAMIPKDFPAREMGHRKATEVLSELARCGIWLQKDRL